MLEGHENSIHALAVLSDGRLASASLDETIRIWDVEGGEPGESDQREKGATAH